MAFKFKTYHRTLAILRLKCPACGKGELFTRKGLFVYRDILNMPDCCEVCHQRYEIEPGFWLGALWTSYPIVVLIEIPFLLLAVFSDLASPWFFFALMLIAFVIAYPLMLRLGRSIWIHNWIPYQEKYREKD